MNCTTCGRENPPHLTFCQECGQRLGPRIAPPTPPIGLPGQDIPSRVPTTGQPMTPGPAPVVPPATTAERKCRVCETLNGPGLRYCTSCGSALEPAPAPAAAPAFPAPAPPPPQPQPAPAPAPVLIAAAPSPAPVPVPSPSPIAPVRMVDLGATTPASIDPTRTCPRCRGLVDPGAQFCKFCGASLASEPSPAPVPMNGGAPPPPPVPNRPATSPMAAPPVPSAAPAPPPPVPAAAPPPPAPPAPAPPASPASVAVTAAPPPPVPRRNESFHGKLVVIAKSGADGPSYPIGDVLDIGRLEGHIVVGEDPYLSPRHVRIAYERGKLVLRDLGSTNGVYLRLAASRDMRAGAGKEGAEVVVPLNDQDLILVGQQVLRFEVIKEGDSGVGPAAEHGTLLFGSPAGPRYARLGQRTVEGITRDVYYVRKVETVFGRESGDVVFTEDPFLSRRHAAVRVVGKDGSPAPAGVKPADARFALVDLGSSNGTFLRIRSEIELVRGDHFRVGQQLFRVDLEGGAPAPNATGTA